jgi:N-hydroxyarylamine O-acetyltransferase
MINLNNITSNPCSELTSIYLNRMGIEQLKKPNADFLFELTIKHMLAFGWDTIDLYLKRKISLDPEKIISKFIKEQRGGVCYESAIAFCYLLNRLGFDAYLSSAYTHGYNDYVFSYPIDTHIVIIVVLENKKYLVDVSWDPPEPILITNMNYINYRNDKYRLRYEHTSNIFYLEKYCSDIWKKQYSFPLTPSHSSSFHKNLDIVINDDEYESFKKLKIMKLTQYGTLALFDKTFITIEHGQQTTRLLEHFSEIKEILKYKFLIDPGFVELYFTGSICESI